MAPAAASRDHHTVVRRAGIAALAVLLVATVLGLAPGTAPVADSQAEPTLTHEPAEGPTGTAVAVSGEGCFLDDGVTGADGVVVLLESEAGEQVASGTLPVERDGTFTGELVIPAGAPVGTHGLSGRCVSPELPVLGEYVGGTFTVTGEGEDALTEEEAAEAARPANGSIEPYPAYDGQTRCSPSAKPGAVAFSQKTLAAFPNTGNYGISRSCSFGGVSEHYEGRAWDWRADASKAAEHRSVDRMLNWLLATDAQGNRHAMARRLGVMYIIWDRQMFRMYRAQDGWLPYTGSSPHTDHVHISFTRAGGAKTTSYWTMRNPPAWGGVGGGNPSPPSPPPPPPPSEPKPASFRQTTLPVNGDFHPLPGDFNGDGHDDVIWYGKGAKRDVIWWGRGGGRFRGVKVTVRRVYQPLVGDFDGDGRDDVFWYGRGRRKDHIWWGTPDSRFLSRRTNVAGTYSPPVTGDFDGDGRDDIFWYGRGGAADYLWHGRRDRSFDGGARSVMGTYRPPFTGDFDGDRRHDVFWYGRGGATDYLWHGRRDRSFDASNRNMRYDRIPLSGNFNGDRRDDVFWYAPGPARDQLWLGDRSRTFHGQSIANVRGSYGRAFVADLDGNGRDVIFWYAPGGGGDYIWWF